MRTPKHYLEVIEFALYEYKRSYRGEIIMNVNDYRFLRVNDIVYIYDISNGEVFLVAVPYKPQ